MVYRGQAELGSGKYGGEKMEACFGGRIKTMYDDTYG